MTGNLDEISVNCEIVIVDDTEDTLILLSGILTDAGYSVSIADSGEKAMEIIQKKQPLLIFIDIMMPDMDGYEVCHLLKSDEKTSEIPIIFISALADKEHIIKGFRTGGADYISKPFRKEEILARVGAHLNLFRLRKELNVKNKALEKEILKRKKSNKALALSEERLRLSLKINRTSVFENNFEKGTVISTPELYNFLGYEAEDIPVSIDEMTKFIHPDDLPQVLKKVNDHFNGITPDYSSEFRMRSKTGEWRWVVGNGKVVKWNKKGKPTILLGISRDIHETKIAGEALRESEFFFRVSQHAANVGSYKYDLVTGSWESSEVFDQIFGIEKQYIKDKDSWKDLIYSEDRKIIERYIRNEVIGKRHNIDRELRISRKTDGETRWVKFSGQFNQDINNKTHILIGTVHDITESKQIIQAIENERKLLRTLIDHLPDAIYVKDKNARKLLANRADMEIMNYISETDIIGKTDLEIFNSAYERGGYDEDIAVLETGQPMLNKEDRYYDRDGKLHWRIISKIPLFDKHGIITGLVGIGHDITEQKKANETIHKLSKSIEQSPSMVVITDTDGNIEYVNPIFTEITGYTLEEATGLNPRLLKSGQTPNTMYEELWKTITSGEVWRGEFYNRKKNGEHFWEWTVITSLKNEEGKITNYIAIKEDITLRKKMEADLVVAKEKAEENDRLKSAFLANMSHEIRTPLNCILGFAELISEPDSQSEPDQNIEFAQLIMASGNNLLSIINNIMDISKIEAGQVQITKTRFVAQHLINDIWQEFGYKAIEKGLQFNIASSTPKKDIHIESDEPKIKQVLINFVGNALKFTENGFIEIGLSVTEDSVQFFVKDTGIGIPLIFHDNIFERFRQVESSTTKKYGGNGLGLAISKSLIEMLGGTIGMESTPGEGSTFYFILPRNQKKGS